MTTPNQGERLARIEALLEALPAMRKDLKAIRDEQIRDVADLAQLKNRGLGLLIGVGLVGGGVGAGLAKFWASLFS